MSRFKIFLLTLLILFPLSAYGQHIDPSQIKTTGPRPYYDPTTGYGASGSNQVTTGNINSGSAALTLTAPIDFVNGQGIAIFGAGPAPSLSIPTGVAGTQVTSLPVIAQVSDLIPGATCSGTTATISTRGWHGLATGQNITATGVGFSQYNITTNVTVLNNYQFTYTIASCPGSSGGGTFTLNAGSTTFTYQIAAIDAFNGVTAVSSSATITGANTPLSISIANKLTWTRDTNAQMYAVYGRVNGSLVCIGTALQPQATGALPTFTDYGGSPGCAPNVPSSPPASPVSQILITNIVNGANTIHLNLATNASTAVSGATVQHDDTASINAAIAAAGNEVLLNLGGGGLVQMGLGNYRVQTLVFPNIVTAFHPTLVFQFGGELDPRQPIRIQDISNYTIRGTVGGTVSGIPGKAATSIINSNGVAPVIDVTGDSNGTNLEFLEIPNCTNDCIELEADPTGGPAYTTMDHVIATEASGGTGSPFHVLAPNGGIFGMFFIA